MKFFKEYTKAYLDFIFVNKQAFDLNKYKQIMKSKFFKKLNNCSKYIELQNFPKFLEWLECKIRNATSNLMQWFDVFYPTKDRANWTVEVVKLWDNQGGHGVVRKVCIERSNHMPSTIELVRKTPKINYLNKHTNNIL